jgi:hypothetical protein
MDYTIPSIYFHIKIYFLINLFNLQQALDWVSISRKVRGLGASVSKTQKTHGVDGGLIYIFRGGSFAKQQPRRGIGRPEPSDHTRSDEIRTRRSNMLQPALTIRSNING